jgi:hypothetical protein
MRYFKLLSFTCFLILAACKPKSDPQIDLKPFFDLVAYFNMESIRLDSLQVVVHTTVLLNGEISNTIDSTPDWDKTFQLMKGFDINKAATASDYIADTAYQNNGNMHIHIESQNEKLIVKNMRIILDSLFNPILIEIAAADESFFKKEDFTYSYIPNKAYGVQGTRKGLFSELKAYEIVGELKF